MAKTKSIFTTAKVVKVKEEVKTSKANGKREVDLGTELNIVAAISSLTDTLETIKATMDAELKAKMTAEFVAEAVKIQRKPDSFKGTSTQSSASCELRKRSTRSVLKPDEVKILQKYGIGTETKIVKDEIPQHYFFNPKAFEDPKLVEKISNRLEGLTTDDGEGLVMLQEGREAVKSEVVGADVLNEVSKKITDPELLTKILKIVSVQALGKFKLDNPSLENIFTILREALVI